MQDSLTTWSPPGHNIPWWCSPSSLMSEYPAWKTTHRKISTMRCIGCNLFVSKDCNLPKLSPTIWTHWLYIKREQKSTGQILPEEYQAKIIHEQYLYQSQYSVHIISSTTDTPLTGKEVIIFLHYFPTSE